MRKSSPKTLAPKFEAIDGDIVGGRAAKAQKAIQDLARASGTSRDDRVTLARLARRAGLPEITLRLLAPVVRTEGRRVADAATDAEKAEYATALRGLGAVDEAIALLETVTVEKYPEASFLLALCHFSKWDYNAAIPLLKSHLDRHDISAYQRLVGETNLAAALIHEGSLREAEGVLKSVEQIAQDGNFQYVLGKTLYFRAELEVLRRNPDKATKYLNVSESFLSVTSPLDRLLSQMWLAIVDHQKDRSEATRKAIGKVREAAHRAEAWEIVRNCDLHQAWFDGDKALYRRVYYGTPSPSFRKRMGVLWPAGVGSGKDYVWTMAPGAAESFSLAEQKRLLKPASVPHRLFHALTSDFYRPMRIPELHAHIYPGEFFNAVSAPLKVKQGLKLLRAALRSAKLPLNIVEKNRAYAFSATAPLSLQVSEEAPMNRADELLRKAHEYFSSPFTAKEAAERLGVPLRTVQRLLESEVEAGHLARSGKTTSVRYRFK